MEQKDRSWTEYFRVITPFLLLVLTFIGGTINKNLSDMNMAIRTIDEKLFHHLTNEELHTPKMNLVSRDQFDIYVKMSTQENARVYDAICGLSKRIDDNERKRTH